MVMASVLERSASASLSRIRLDVSIATRPEIETISPIAAVSCPVSFRNGKRIRSQCFAWNRASQWPMPL